MMGDIYPLKWSDEAKTCKCSNIAATSSTLISAPKNWVIALKPDCPWLTRIDRVAHSIPFPESALAY